MKKYLFILPIVTSCSTISNKSNIWGSKKNGSSNQVNNVGIHLEQSDSLVSLPRYNIAPLFKKGLRLSAVINLLEELEIFLAKHKKIFSTYDSELKYISDLIKPYKDLITTYHLAAAATLKLKSFGEAVCVNGGKVYATKSTILLDDKAFLSSTVSFYEIVLRYSNIDFFKMLLKHGANKNDLLYCATRKGKLEWVQSLVEDKEINADINYISLGRNILGWAIFDFHKDVFDYLWDKGARLVGTTPIHMAVKDGKPEILNTIIDKLSGAVDLTDSNGNTALRYAAGIVDSHIVSSVPLLSCVNILVNRGADIYAKDSNQKTPFRIAEECNNKEVLEVLKRSLLKK